ncbi:MAG: hydrogenase small subunit [Thermoanaerobaculia bacterium]
MSATDDRDYTSISEYLERSGVSRRDFVSFCGKLMVAAPFGLALTNFLDVEAVAAEVGAARRPSVIWLHMQECTGCTETLLRPVAPDLATLLFDVISLDYHETVMAASGHDAEAALHDAMKANDGKFVLVVEGSTPLGNDGKYLKIANQLGSARLKAIASRAAAVISMGSCSSWGGVQSAGPNPTNAVGTDQVVKDKPVVNIPGCPPNPYVLLAVVLQYARTGTLPELDAQNRPKFAYDRVIHDHCPRRAHFDAGRFAAQFGDQNHRSGYCLYKLGCKGPVTHAPCSTRHFNDMVDVWPIGIGAPCFGCTEKGIGYTMALHETAPITRPLGPDTYPGIFTEASAISPLATGVAGVAAGVLAGAGIAFSRKLDRTGGNGDNPETKE